MRIVTWNCNSPTNAKSQSTLDTLFADKSMHLSAVYPDSDIQVYQEIARPSHINPRHTYWAGQYAHRGIAVMTREPYHIEPITTGIRSHSVFPLRIIGPETFTLLSVWSLPHQPHPSFTDYVQEILTGIHAYHELLIPPLIVIGDFNSSARFDANSIAKNHADVRYELEEMLGLTSCYHHIYNVEHGKEMQHPTFYMYRHEDKPYHIDYCYASSDWNIHDAQVGSFHAWKAYSDHCPLIVALTLKE